MAPVPSDRLPGALDGAEAEHGSNPLDGMATQPGVITAVDTPGNAVDIAMAEGRAVVADAEGGLTVFDLSNPFEPIEMARLQTTNWLMAVVHWKEWMAAAEQPKTLLVATLEGPQWIQPAFRKRFKEDVLLVAFWNAHALAGAASGELAMIDLTFGETVEQLQLNGPVMDMVIQNSVLYAMTPGRLHVISLQTAPLKVSTHLSIPGLTASSRRHRLSVARDRLYTTHLQGFNVYDITQPLAPTLAAHHVTTQFGWKQIIPTESGLAVAALRLNSTTNGPHNLYLTDLGTAGTNFPSGPIQLVVGPSLYDYAGNAMAETNLPMEILSFSMDSLSLAEVTNVIDQAGATDSFRFAIDEYLVTLEAGQTIRLEVVAFAPSLAQGRWSWVDPAGKVVLQSCFGCGPQNLPATTHGIYRVVVDSDRYDQAGAYQFRLMAQVQAREGE